MIGFSSGRLVRPFTRQLLAVDLPGLSGARRDETVEFAVRRVDGLPSILRFGVTCIAVPMRGVVSLPWSAPILAWLISHPLPLVGEYVRMVRSLAYTYVWEQWPAAAPDGSMPS